MHQKNLSLSFSSKNHFSLVTNYDSLKNSVKTNTLEIQQSISYRSTQTQFKVDSTLKNDLTFRSCLNICKFTKIKLPKNCKNYKIQFL